MRYLINALTDKVEGIVPSVTSPITGQFVFQVPPDVRLDHGLGDSADDLAVQKYAGLLSLWMTDYGRVAFDEFADLDDIDFDAAGSNVHAARHYVKLPAGTGTLETKAVQVPEAVEGFLVDWECFELVDTEGQTFYSELPDSALLVEASFDGGDTWQPVLSGVGDENSSESETKDILCMRFRNTGPRDVYLAAWYILYGEPDPSSHGA